jgi:hypothetical protein
MKKRNFLHTHKFTIKIFHEININVRKKVTLKTIHEKMVGLISLNPMSPLFI